MPQKTVIRTLFEPFRNISAIGVELEGGWDEHPCDCHDIKGDGSVNVSASRVGEIPLGPLVTWETAKEEIRRHYPHVVNRTCGLHVHLSFPTPGHYSALMSSRFEPYLLARLRAYGRRKGFSPNGQFFQRIAGRNHYCAKRYTDARADAQARPTDYKSDERYAFLNYAHGYHGTLEVRGLPAFTRPTAAVNAIYFLCQSFEKFLSLPGALRPDIHALDASSDATDAIEDFADMLDASASIAELRSVVGDV